MIRFDHMYTNDPHHRFHKRLEKLGFKLSENRTEHPGRQFCRFIAFQPERKSDRCYLEFVNVKKGGEKIKCPGLSLGFTGKLERLHLRLTRKTTLKPRFIHKNYDWKKDSKSRLPGWNFVTFKGLGIRGFFPWMTEYERSPHRPPQNRRPIVRHPNGARRIIGLELEVNARGRYFFDQLLGKKTGESVRLTRGVVLYLKPSRRTALNAVIIESTNLNRFAKHAKIRTLTRWRGRPAAEIKNPAGHWNVIVI